MQKLVLGRAKSAALGASRTILILMRHLKCRGGACGHAAEAGLRCSHVAPWTRRSGIISNCDWYNRQSRSQQSERPINNEPAEESLEDRRRPLQATTFA